MHIAKHHQEYNRYQIVARMGKAGEFSMHGRRFWLWKYMTLWAGKNIPAIAVEYVRKAPQDKDGFLRIEDMREGEIIITPGLVYRKIPMSGVIMAEHLRRMKKFRPRDIMVTQKDTDAEAVDLGIIDMRKDK